MGRYSVGTWLGLGALGVGESLRVLDPRGGSFTWKPFVLLSGAAGGSAEGGEVGDAAFSLELFSP